MWPDLVRTCWNCAFFFGISLFFLKNSKCKSCVGAAVHCFHHGPSSPHSSGFLKWSGTHTQTHTQWEHKVFPHVEGMKERCVWPPRQQENPRCLLFFCIWESRTQTLSRPSLKMEKAVNVATINAQRCVFLQWLMFGHVTTSCEAASELKCCLLHICGQRRCHFPTLPV